ncbi:hypothetical protein [Rubrivivax gelatinosus]|uniref:Transcriptional regulator n=1 Tax=Rubrivivax gelatinosus TaxID=28068 RepID=A0ABS1DP87_RUBGE|nr:hypothetical protein [Rubrivivax gelatinosus]MBK1711273.1 hypothetical protein [Rubrivivax gelatinosus]
MSPFDPNYRGQLAAELTSPAGRARAEASRAARRRRELQLTSDDPAQRWNASCAVAGLGVPSDPAKAARIRKPSRL